VSVTTVLLAGLPRMLEDMISSVLKPHSDIRVISGAVQDNDLVAAASAAGAQVVVVTRRDPANLADVDPRLARAAMVSIIAIAPDAASACLHALRSDSAHIDDVSAEEILRALGVGAPDRAGVRRI
jgi:hypothetical protein